METRANFALIGAFVLLATLAVVGFVLWLGSSQFNRNYAEYDIVFQGPVTLEKGAAVRYIGIKVGEVDTVRIDQRDASKVRARVKIDASTPVKTDSTAIIDFAGITGVTFIQINAGSERAGPLLRKPGETVPVIPAGPTPLAALFNGGAEVVGQVSQALFQIEALLTDENISAISNTLHNIESITEAIAAEDEQTLANANDTLRSLTRAGDRLTVASDAFTALSGQVQGDLPGLTADLKSLVASVDGLTGEVSTTLGDGRAAIASAMTLMDGSATRTLEQTALAAQDLRVVLMRLDQLVRDLEQNPQTLVQGNPRPYEKER